jgi:transcriptional regulator with XRE-family HTH domain
VQPQSADHQALGRAIRELRKERGISQEELAHRCGLDRSYMGATERGERNISLKVILRIADGLDISVVTLFERFDQQRRER